MAVLQVLFGVVFSHILSPDCGAPTSLAPHLFLLVWYLEMNLTQASLWEALIWFWLHRFWLISINGLNELANGLWVSPCVHVDTNGIFEKFLAKILLQRVTKEILPSRRHSSWLVEHLDIIVLELISWRHVSLGIRDPSRLSSTAKFVLWLNLGSYRPLIVEQLILFEHVADHVWDFVYIFHRKICLLVVGGMSTIWR